MTKYLNFDVRANPVCIACSAYALVIHRKRLLIDMTRETAGTHRANTASTAGTWFQGKRLPLYGVVGGAFLLGGYVFFFYTAKHPETTANTSRKNQELPGEEHNKQAQEYQKNQPTRKLAKAAGKEKGDASIFPNKEAGKKLSEAKDN